MEKPISLNSLRFSDKKGKLVVREDYGLTFSDTDKLEIFIKDRFKYWKELFKMEITVSPDQNETIEELNIKNVFKLTAKYMGIRQSDVLKRINIPGIVEARRFGMMICLERGVTPSTIARSIGYDHATVGHHRDKFYGFCETEKGYHDRFLEIQDSVLIELNGRFEQDGSGKKINNHE